MTLQGAVGRWQRVMQTALAKMDTLRLSGSLDEYFYETLRESMLEAGATDSDIDAIAAWLVTYVVESTEAGSVERYEQFDLIVDHLSCTKMRIGLGRADVSVSIEFPNRARAH